MLHLSLMGTWSFKSLRILEEEMALGAGQTGGRTFSQEVIVPAAQERICGCHARQRQEQC